MGLISRVSSRTYRILESNFKNQKKMSQNKVVPGERLSTTEEYQPGNNVYVHEGQIFASIVGQRKINSQTISVTPTNSIHVPTVGSLALFRVHRVKMNQINGNIVMVIDENDKQLKSLPASEMNTLYSNRQSLTNLGFPAGMIRREDIRLTEKDNLVLKDCFQPGDFVLCRVLSLGDNKDYFLSTAENQLGVVWAKCKSSNVFMLPKSWIEMVCPKSGVVERRKCAKLEIEV